MFTDYSSLTSKQQEYIHTITLWVLKQPQLTKDNS